MDETEHWRLRLIELKGAKRASQAAMAAAMGVDASYFSRLLYPLGKKGRKNLGLETLRSLCKAYQLRYDWFDLPLGTMLPGAMGMASPATAQGDYPMGRTVGEPAGHEPARPAIAWPFKDVPYQRLRALMELLGPQAGEAVRDLDTLLDIAVARWEKRAAQLGKLTG